MWRERDFGTHLQVERNFVSSRIHYRLGEYILRFEDGHVQSEAHPQDYVHTRLEWSGWVWGGYFGPMPALGGFSWHLSSLRSSSHCTIPVSI